MNKQRAFSVVVTGCAVCPMRGMTNACNHLKARRMLPRQANDLFSENRDAITPTCPMWNEAKPIGELK